MSAIRVGSCHATGIKYAHFGLSFKTFSIRLYLFTIAELFLILFFVEETGVR